MVDFHEKLVSLRRWRDRRAVQKCTCGNEKARSCFIHQQESVNPQFDEANYPGYKCKCICHEENRK